MEKTATFSIAGLTFDWNVVISTLVVVAVVFLLALWTSRKLVLKPAGKSKQNMLEWVIDFTNNIVDGSLPNKTGNGLKFFIFSLFLFIFVGNQLGVAFTVAVNGDTFLNSPTANPLVTMTLALIAISIAHFLGVEKQGFKNYFKSVYLSPFSVLLPLNLIEQFTSFLTLGLRLFGNIFAGEMVLSLLWQLAQSAGVVSFVPAFVLTIIWQAFSLFIGAIQAFVFVTLTTVYVSEKTE
ncbi:F0F1 ATP synthase subunit A [Weissella bombi]|uniref:ATP synthase subunit a n=1 Tax=Weissella bombi TaxID=1505725 RepID=A0A1C4B0N5_9LACO|nr:F0F1 ATP synthase subunit A [Weissella bombi]SCC00298.1 F-type H+-transporting ATPase subunit a [Weissella bombi]